MFRHFLLQCKSYGRCYSTLRRSYLYVPSSSERMLEKSRKLDSDIIIYDLEDSVAPNAKQSARTNLVDFLSKPDIPFSDRLAVRVNSIGTPYFEDDVSQVLQVPLVGSVVLPKIHSAQDLDHVSRSIHATAQPGSRKEPLRIVASIESARAMWNLRDIASWKSKYDPLLGGTLSALLFAAEDYCADTSIIRSKSRQELLYTRSQIVIAAKAFNLEAIDMVCVNYKDLDYLKEECRDGRKLGFTGKQAIHPTQVDVIQSTFVPTSQGTLPISNLRSHLRSIEILRAAKILKKMEVAHSSKTGAVGIEGEMIDAPMVKQAEVTVRVAKAAGIPIPDVD